MDRIVEARKEPRISVNKLGEYLTATPARRRRIVHDAKYPSTFMVMRYTAAENAIADWICSGCTDDLMLAQAMATLGAAEPGSQFSRVRRDCCLQALDRAGELRDRLNLPTNRVSYVRSNASIPVEFDKVAVSIRPEVLIYTRGNDQTGDNDESVRRLGGIKLYLAKQHPLDQRSADTITTLLWQSLLIRSAQELLPLDLEQIKVVDVFAGEVFTLPKARKQRLKDIAAACSEIQDRWPAIKR
jgi:hypothetical protein